MSRKHPIVAITGSSGAGTSTDTRTFQHIFRREEINAVIVEGDSFHKYDRQQMKLAGEKQRAAGNDLFSHFGPEANLLEELAALFKTYGETGQGKVRKYLHDEEEAAPYQQPPGVLNRRRVINARALEWYNGSRRGKGQIVKGIMRASLAGHFRRLAKQAQGSSYEAVVEEGIKGLNARFGELTQPAGGAI